MSMRIFRNIFFGQCISLMLTGSGIFSKILERSQASVPALQSMCSFVLMSIIFLVYRWYLLKKEMFYLQVPLWVYIGCALVDVQANVTCLTAFRYANFATVAVLLHMTIPFVTAMSYFILETRYSWKHYVGCVVATSGTIVIFFADYSAEINGDFSEEFRGNLLVVVAAFLYAVSNVVQEACVRGGSVESNTEFVSMIGFFGAIITALQAFTLERNEISSITWSLQAGFAMAGYSIDISLLYIFISVYLRVAGSLMFNLSVLTGDFFTVIASYVIFGESVNNYYWLALALNIIGVTLYSIDEPTAKPGAELHSLRKFSTVDEIEEGGKAYCQV